MTDTPMPCPTPPRPRRSDTRIAEMERRVQETAAALEKERAVSATMLDSAGSLVMMVDSAGRIIRFNQTCQQVTGYALADVQGRPFWEVFLSPERAREVKAAFSQHQARPEGCTFDSYWRTKIGHERLIAWSYSVLYDSAGGLEYIVGIGNDLTARKEAEEAIAHLSQQNELILNAAGDGIYGLDCAGRITFINPAAAHMLGYEPADLRGRVAHHVMHHTRPDGTLYPRDACPIHVALSDGAVHRVVNEVYWRKGGDSFPVECVSTPIQQDSRIIGAVVTFRDITERKRAQEALEQMALHDALTTLPNRVLLHDRLVQAVQTAERSRHPLALLLLDLDHFKEINDTLGHRYGDLLLQQVAARLRGARRAMDTVARLGGDEFAVLLPVSDRASAEAMASALIAALEQPFVVEGQHLVVGASIGIALGPGEGADAQMLLRQADVAMYVAKRGRQGYDVYSPDLDEHSPERLALMASLRPPSRTANWSSITSLK